ncbi:hypothetical protein [Nocardia caishijiensis]|uniref:Uncharacterized protein n=1 Tax=Nocardia caishijiensis TaxID=184756 RepID=A0ABQ6YHM1_9NOCA|nr:hypothetical protein [Nocardia caishijiensis]KAF0845292.1 hypothetical protein FNL39_108100 [Nocardia caishijiensis]
MTGHGQVTPRPPAQVRIGLWGPPGSGKTTYLAALRLAVFQSKLPGSWKMSGVDVSSSDFLTQSTKLLTDERRFPPATLLAQNMIFQFVGERTVLPEPAGRRLWGRSAPAAQPSVERDAFDLDVLDVPGSVFRHEGNARAGSDDQSLASELRIDDDEPSRGNGGDDAFRGAQPVAGSEDQLLEHLEACQGIVFLFDPVRDAEEGDAFDYFHPILEKLAARMLQYDNAGSRLPHRVAVCITKFDDEEVFRIARNRGYTVTGVERPYFPTVDNGRAKDFFLRLCQDNFTYSDLVYQGLMRYFYEDRIEFFVTSAIGFYAPTGRFMLGDYTNTERDDSGELRIKGKVQPINLLEPLVWLHQNLLGLS